MHPLSRLCALAFALAFLVGLPYLLLWHVAWPALPASWDVALAYLRGWRFPPGVLPATLIVALWTLWGLFALALAAEAVARLRGVTLHLRPLGPLQAVAATAVAATALTPAVAFADTVAPADDREERTPEADSGHGAPEAPQSAAEQGPIERTRTVSGFEIGSADLSERMREDLAPTVEMLEDHWDEDVPVEITGHTDPSGDPDRNQELSEERARAVADYLEESLGQDAPDTEVSGVGSDQPVEGSAESQRRVEIAYTLAPAPAPAPAPQQRDGDGTDAEEAAAAAQGTGESQPQETEPQEAEEQEAEAPVVTVDNASATEADGPRVVVVEVPDGAVAGVVGFAGLAGGYLLGKRGSFVPRMALSLPRPRLLTGRPRRLAIRPAPAPERPVPGDEIDGRVTVELDHVPGLGLTGKGAEAAVRRLIANALNTREPLAVRILITEREAVRLLGESGRDLLRDQPCEPVTMVATMEDALTFLALELHALKEEDRAPLALVTSPDPEHEHALSGLLLHGQHRGVTAVILGSWPLGGNCVVDLDGLISQTSQPLATLIHCSWAGSTAEEVREALLAYHESDHAVSERRERPERPSSRRDTEAREDAEHGRPVLVAEDWDDDDAFTRVGDNAAWDRLVRIWDEESESADADGSGAGPVESPEVAGGAKSAEPVEDVKSTEAAEPSETAESAGVAPDDGAAISASFGALRETDGGTGASGVEGVGVEPVDTPEAGGSAEVAEPFEEVKSAQAAQPAETPEPAGSAEVAEPVEDTEVAEEVKSAGTAESAESSEVAKPVEEAGVAEAVESPEATGDSGRGAGRRDRLAPDDGAAISASFGALRETGGGTGTAAVDDHDDSWWDEASGVADTGAERGAAPTRETLPDADADASRVVEPVAPSTADSGAERETETTRAVEPVVTPSVATEVERARVAPAVAEPTAGSSPTPAVQPTTAATAPQLRDNKETRSQRAPGRKAGRVRVVRVDRPVSAEPGERSTRGSARPRGVQQPLKDGGTSRRAPQQVGAAVTAPALSGQGVAALEGEEVPLSKRPQPAKPRKAGRGRGPRPGEQD